MMAFDLEESDPLERVKKFWELISVPTAERQGNHFGSFMVPLIKPISSKVQYSPSGTPHSATTTFSLTVTKELMNVAGNLHGGAAATLIDIITTAAIAPLAKKGYFEYPGVSRTLQCGYLRPVKEGEECEVVCECLGTGKRAAAVRVVIRRESDGVVCVEGTHHKISTDPIASL